MGDVNMKKIFRNVKPKQNKEFKFSRIELLSIFSIILVAFSLIEYVAILRINNPNQFLILNLSAFGVIGFFVFFISFFYCDIIIKKNELDVIYFGWYLFRFPREKSVLFKDIKEIHHTYIHPTYASITIVTNNTSIIIFYFRLNDPFSFLKTLLSKVPKNCKIIGFDERLKQ